jgi:uroporphyrin-3 C-methyltransferase
VNTEISEVHTEETEPEQPEKREKRGGGALAFLAFLFSLAAVAGTAWMWWQDQSSMGREEERLLAEISRLETGDSELALKIRELRDEVDALSGQDTGAELEALQARLENDRQQAARIEESIEEQLALSRSLQSAADSMHGRLLAAEAALSEMSTQELDAGRQLDLAEVDYLLRLANERLRLFSDPEAADQALEVADMHLASLDNPAYFTVRQDIAAARRELAAVDIPDYLDIADRLDSIQDSIPGLPFMDERAMPSAPPPESETGWWERLKATFASLVTIRRSTEEESQRISLEDKDYVRQRVWLQLEIAHLSLMRRDQEGFRNALRRVQESVDAWFDPTAPETRSAEVAIAELMAVEVDVPIPDITAPWNSLRQIRSGLAPAPAAAEAAGEGGE